MMADDGDVGHDKLPGGDGYGIALKTRLMSRAGTRT
jgi:hypothetical protein